MPELIDPTVRLRTSFLAAVTEFRENSDYPVPWFITDIKPPALTDAVAFADYVSRLVAEGTEAGVRTLGAA